MTALVGIVNITPDSFSDGGEFIDPEKAIEHAEQLFRDGALIVDIGAESTRPNAMALSSEQEWQRLEQVLPALIKNYPEKISLDSYHPETIKRALNIGPAIVNDVTGLNNSEMLKVLIDAKPRVIISHMNGSDIQAVHRGDLIDDIEQVKVDLLKKANLLLSNGYIQTNIILDPGIGFGKTPQLNVELVEFARLVPEYKVMIGYSRKRFLGEHRMSLQPNIEAGKRATASGAAYLRVHDVKGHAGRLPLSW